MTLNEEQELICMAAIQKFCDENGFAMPELNRTDDGGTVWFTGKSPDDREFGLGYLKGLID